MFSKPARRLRLAVALAAVLGVVASCAGVATSGSPAGSPAPSVGHPVPDPAPVVGSRGAGAIPAPAPGTLAPGPVSVQGWVQTILPNGDLVLLVGQTPYTVTRTPATLVVNLKGRRVPANFIANPVTVTGIVAGMSIAAQTVLVSTTKDAAD